MYAALPVWGQHAAVTAFGAYWHWARFGPGFSKRVQAFEERERFSKEAWDAWTAAATKALLQHAVTHVPFYRDTWSRDQKQAAEQGELQGIPLLEKEPLRATPTRFLADNIKPRMKWVFHTSGSTGTPIASYYTLSELRDSLAVREVRSARWAGVSFQQPRATFSGRMVEPNPESRGPYHRFNAVERQVYFSAFHLRKETAAQYVLALREHKIAWLTGYAVSWFLLGRLMLELGIKPPPLKAIITTSEKVTQPMRAVMEQAFGCPVFEEYSTVENAVFASECEHRKLHVSPDVGVLEILRPDGSACGAREPGEVVVTRLGHRYQPLVRFRLGDVAEWDGQPCTCGRSLPVLASVVGRLEDVVTGPDGRQMVRFHGLYIDLPNVIEGQVVQEAVDRMTLRIVGTAAFGEADEKVLLDRVRQRLGPEMKARVERVDHIERTKAGKFKAVISMVGKQADVAR